jgi:hypothetical protein
MSKRSEAVKTWRKNTKLRIIDAMGGECACCGYKKCSEALDLHHLNPEEKEMGFGKIRANPISWKKIVAELRKCVLLCNRCHQEVHAEYRQIPEDASRFDESYTEYRGMGEKEPCPVCGNGKPKRNKTCSHSCAAKLSRKVDWGTIDLHDLLVIKKMPIARVADQLDLSWNAVSKRAKKLGIVSLCGVMD